MLRNQDDDTDIRVARDGALLSYRVTRRMPPAIRQRAAMRLIQLDAATTLEDLWMPPSNRLEALQGDRKGTWSIRINVQWRICFRFAAGDAFDVEVVDYH